MISIGANANAFSNVPGTYGVAIGAGGAAGGGAVSYGDNTIAIGGGNATTARPAVTGSGQGNIAIGSNSGAGGFGIFDTNTGVYNITPLANTGLTAIGFGAEAGARANGQNDATAIGARAIANAVNATALGVGAIANGDNATAVGRDAQTFSVNEVALGTSSRAYAASGAGIAIGNGAAAGTAGLTTNGDPLAIGTDAKASGGDAIALGGQSNAAGASSIAIGGFSGGGAGTTAAGDNSIVLGLGAVDNAVANSTVLGTGASIAAGVQGSNVALGQGTQAAIGSQTNYAAAYLTQPQTSTGEVAVGNRQITGIAAGSAPTDAVNVSQLQAGVASVPVAANNTFGLPVPSATGASSFAAGFGATASNPDAIALGEGATAAASQAIAIGNGSSSTSDYTTSVGTTSVASSQNSTAIGGQAASRGNSSTAIGAFSNSLGDFSVALGQGATATVVGGVALGQGALANRNGLNGDAEFFSGTAVASTNGAVSVGAAGAERQITNVAGGTRATDAVNLRQLQAVGGNLATAIGGGANFSTTTGAFTSPTYTLNNGTMTTNNVGDALTNLDGRTTTNTSNITALQNGTSGLVQQANGNAPITVGAATGGTVVNVAGTAGNRQITGVAAGAVNAASTDAVNGSQLFTLAQQGAAGITNLGSSTAAAIGGGATYNAVTTSITGPSYQLNGSGQTFTNVVAGQQALSSGAAGPIQYATPGTPSNALNLVGAGAPVTLANVAAGTLSVNSTEAVNGSQLFATNQAITNLQAGAAGLFVSNNANRRLGPTATGVDASAGGFGATASGVQSTAVGNAANAAAANATALGFGAQATGSNSTALGQGANGGLANSVAVGQGSIATAASSTTGNAALGVSTNAGAVAAGSGNVFSVGQAGAARQIQNVAAGAVTATSTDAVNGSQLFSVATNVNSVGTGAATAIGGGAAYNAATGTFTGPSYGLNGSGATYTNAVSGIQAIASGAAGPVQYATPGTPSNGLNLVGTGGAVALGNVATGTLSATSTQAVNGSQLFATNQQVAGNSAAIGVLQGQTATNTGNIVALQTGQAGLFRANNADGLGAPQASGANAVAGGFGSVASAGSTTAIGTGAQATMTGAIAIGAGAIATGDPTTAVGFNAVATGNEASAFGAFAAASGANSTALGRSATAVGSNATAVGFGSNATGAGSVAIGVGASAQQANSVAVGTGVATTRANQVAFGTGGQTYTLAGVTSAQSLAEQTGGTGFVTTDAAGNLAASGIGPSSIAALDGRVSSLEAGFGALSRYAVETRREARQGVAVALALSSAPLPSAPGKLTYTLNGATFKGEYGLGGAIAYRLDTLSPIAITAGVGGGGRGDVGVRFGIMGEL
ncbi:beta strand repeat-containing protein [Methylobacterium sp. J-076]|uniref:beta strand repeat-containing protein n=1 Tax=Methylobacterium sp. J-076 TaxID=2836655 RepID=UPI001FB90FE8|nr:hypothetical protein [Methylobacterium sp. J-076]MCJ2012322.1 hypothetical protein [Methylobacterium sp. J-076]